MRPVRADEVVEKVAGITATPCRVCGRSLCEHEALISVVMGFSVSPRCLPCMAAPLAVTGAELLDDVYAHVLRRDCYLAGWRWADEHEPPGCGWASPSAGFTVAGEPVASRERSDEAVAASWDAGATACGELVLELRQRLAPLSAGVLFELVANDPGAREDIPAWCAMTRHTLVQASHPVYVIRVRAD